MTVAYGHHFAAGFPEQYNRVSFTIHLGIENCKQSQNRYCRSSNFFFSPLKMEQNNYTEVVRRAAAAEGRRKEETKGPSKASPLFFFLFVLCALALSHELIFSQYLVYINPCL